MVWHVSPYGLRFVNRIGGWLVSSRFSRGCRHLILGTVKRQRLDFRLSDAATIKMSAKNIKVPTVVDSRQTQLGRPLKSNRARARALLARWRALSAHGCSSPNPTLFFTLVRAVSPTAIGNRYCVNDGRPYPHHTDGDTSFFQPSNQRYAHMPTACGLTALAVQALPAESFVGLQ
jgi:hypothetical protein